jgi:thiamine biosynthesis protein ThiS
MTITDLLSANDAAGPGVAVERNQKVVCRTDHSKTVIKAGDKIEIVRLVGGG